MAHCSTIFSSDAKSIGGVTIGNGSSVGCDGGVGGDGLGLSLMILLLRGIVPI